MQVTFGALFALAFIATCLAATDEQIQSCRTAKDKYKLAPYPCDARKYLSCSEDRQEVLAINTCPSNLVYNPDLGGCDYDFNVEKKPPCASGKAPEDNNDPDTCDGLLNDYIRDKSSCKRFIHCSLESPYEQVCPEGFYFLKLSTDRPNCYSYKDYVNNIDHMVEMRNCHAKDPWEEETD